ncbi:aminotransferase class IV [Clostridium rectalis]|uniref:aminotransferase class IV n=1 Tax=Clostridium rectalis TaxID=2040295 RepID=UPI000F63F5BC|nr:aminotransferase class IV [Clostridium rectalis]
MNKVNEFVLLDGELYKSLEYEDILGKGKALYEVLKVKNSVPLFLERHLERLHNSSKLTGLKIWISDNYIKESLYKLIKSNNVEEGSLKFVLNFQKNKFLVFFEDKSFPTIENYNSGVKVAFYSRERCNPNAKVLNMEFRKDLDKFIKENEIFEGILLDKNNDITEGSKSNVFIIKDNMLYTTPVKEVLPGTTRSIVFDICKELEISIIEKKTNKNEINNIQGMFISSTPFDILPVSQLEGKNLYSSHNQIIQNIMNKYNDKVERYIRENSLCWNI